jgi:MYXO-CTERM domain-containing protein
VNRSTLALAALLALAPAVAAAETAHSIVIDPGHGGTDPGGTGNAMEEKNVVLDVSKRFKALLDADSADTAGGGKWTAYMTRTTDVYVSLAGRSAYSNNKGADRFMCIHSNAFSDPSAHGTETFSYATTGNGAALRNLVQAEVLKAWNLTDRGNKTANFAVLRDTAAPAELHELAFITNATDAAHLKSLTERQKAAEAHLRAIQRHYNITPYIPGTQPQTETGSIVGVVSDDLGPIAGAIVTLDDGTEVVTPEDGTFKLEGAAKGMHDVTAAADGHDSNTVQVTVAASVDNNLDIVLVRSEDGSGSGDPDPGTSDPGGCATGGSSTSILVALGLVGLIGSRRRSRP